MTNLDDSMTASELFDWHFIYQRATNHQRLELFGRIGTGTVRALKDCANYAANKGTAMQCRERGDTTTALMYERIADKIYNSLPSYAKW